MLPGDYLFVNTWLTTQPTRCIPCPPGMLCAYFVIFFVCMPLTADKVRVGKCAEALMVQVESDTVITVSYLAKFMLDVGHPNMQLGACVCAHHGCPARALVLVAEQGGRYHMGSLEDPTMTALVVMHLLQMDNHAIAVAVRNCHCERLLRSLVALGA